MQLASSLLYQETKNRKVIISYVHYFQNISRDMATYFIPLALKERIRYEKLDGDYTKSINSQKFKKF